VKVSVVIPSHDGARFLGPCLDSLRAARIPAGCEVEVVVVDNGSTDGSPELLARRRDVKAAIFDRPLGFAHANNAARKIATGEVICFLNNDTTVDAGFFERPLRILEEDPRVAAVGSKLLFMHRFVKVSFSLPKGTRLLVGTRLFCATVEDKVRGVRGWAADGDSVYLPRPIPGIDAAQLSPPVVRILAAEGPADGASFSAGGGKPRRLSTLPAIAAVDMQLPSVRLIQNAGSALNERGEGSDVGSGEEDDGRRFTSEEVVPSLCGAAMFVRRSALERAGWFPDYYTMYYEDTDLCLRLREQGGLLVFCPASVVNHYHTGTSREFSPKFVRHVARSSLLFLTRHGSARQIVTALGNRARDIRGELSRGAVLQAWGAQGFLSALPAVGAPALSRLRQRLSHSGSPAGKSLRSAARAPYVPQR